MVTVLNWVCMLKLHLRKMDTPLEYPLGNKPCSVGKVALPHLAFQLCSDRVQGSRVWEQERRASLTPQRSAKSWIWDARAWGQWRRDQVCRHPCRYYRVPVQLTLRSPHPKNTFGGHIFSLRTNEIKCVQIPLAFWDSSSKYLLKKPGSLFLSFPFPPYLNSAVFYTWEIKRWTREKN